MGWEVLGGVGMVGGSVGGGRHGGVGVFGGVGHGGWECWGG